VIVVCSDGVTETENPEGMDYGHARMVERMRLSGDLRPDVALAGGLADLSGFRAAASQSDDVTLMVLRRSA